MKSVIHLRILLLAAAILPVGACKPDGGPDVSASTAAIHERAPESEHVQKLAGLSHLPVPENREAFAASMRRHFPRQLMGVRPRTAVLVDVSVGTSGIVEEVRVVDHGGTGDDGQVRAVVRQKVPGTNQVVERELNATYDAAFGPALRDGRPVPYTMRMTVEFTDPASKT
jgi:hypothetical protein